MHFLFCRHRLQKVNILVRKSSTHHQTENKGECNQNSEGRVLFICYLILLYPFFLLLHTLVIVVKCRTPTIFRGKQQPNTILLA